MIESSITLLCKGPINQPLWENRSSHTLYDFFYLWGVDPTKICILPTPEGFLLAQVPWFNTQWVDQSSIRQIKWQFDPGLFPSDRAPGTHDSNSWFYYFIFDFINFLHYIFLRSFSSSVFPMAPRLQRQWRVVCCCGEHCVFSNLILPY
jgi:hypothetical protein